MRRAKIPGKVQDIIANPGDWRKIAEFIRGVGHELPRKRLVVLAELRSCIANAGLGNEPNGEGSIDSAFLNGAMFAVLELCAAYDAAVEDECSPKSDHFDGLGCPVCSRVAHAHNLTLKDLKKLGLLAKNEEGRPAFVRHFACCEKHVT